MRFAIFTGLGMTTWDSVRDLWRHLDATGWDAACVTDHFMPNTPERTGDMLECWTTLSALAAETKRLRIGTIVLGNTYRHPAVLANVAATVDHISGGRLVMGLGAGWQENEHDAYGLHFGTVRERLERLEEACQVIKGLFEQERTTFDGTYYTLRDAVMQPKPLQERIPLLIGGGGEKVTMRIAATYADEWNVWGLPDLLAQKGKVLDEHCERLGRDPKSIGRSAQALLYLGDDQEWLNERKGRVLPFPAIVGTPAEVQDVIGQYQAAGVTEFIIPTFNLGPPDRIGDTLKRFSEEVASAFR